MPRPATSEESIAKLDSDSLRMRLKNLKLAFPQYDYFPIL
jgi:hypothetical protein